MSTRKNNLTISFSERQDRIPNSRRTTSFFKTCIMIFVLSLTCTPSLNATTERGLKFVETADGRQSKHSRELVQWTHSRLVFNKTLKRVAVGQEATMQVEVLGANEVLALAKKVGRTSIIVWYTDGSTETFLFSVVEDLSVLRSALRDIHPAIRIQLAPDRAALVLRGRVPTIDFRVAAENAARNYLDVAQSKHTGVNVLMQSPMNNPIIEKAMQSAGFRISQDKPSTPDYMTASSATIINLVQVDKLPLSLKEKLQQAIVEVGGKDVTVKRMQPGDIANRNNDTLLLSGSVNTQVELVRVLNIAARLYAAEYPDLNIDGGSIKVLANESGGLMNQESSGSLSAGIGGLGSTQGKIGNNVNANIGRAKLVSIAGGKVLSTIEVRDLPQVRVSVQMHEVSRRRLKSWRPDLSVVSNGYDDSGIFGIGGRSQAGANSSTVESALQILGGTLINNIQLGGSDMAFDLLFSLLEEEGISRTLSRPTLTVLAGESAVFRAGGEVPVPRAFAPSGLSTEDSVGTNTNGVFSGTDFKSFGVELEVRALVDEDDRITLDMRPTISMPDTQLTQDIANSTGGQLNSAAFNVRTLTTTSRLRDGQALVIGGLVSRDIADNESHTPGLSSVPLFGNLAKSSSKSDNDKELIIIVTPTIVREAKHSSAQWQFSDSSELLQRAISKNVRSSNSRY